MSTILFKQTTLAGLWTCVYLIHLALCTAPRTSILLEAVPPFVLEYAPVLHLHVNETFWPSSPENHLRHSFVLGPDNQSVFPPPKDPFSILVRPDLNNVNSYITTIDNTSVDPRKFPWLRSAKPSSERKSVAPATLILVDKSDITGVSSTLDAFWFYFYSMNYGPEVGPTRFGNHIGDWEHHMVRFVNGTPTAIHYSAHDDGAAYTYKCVEKIDNIRPVGYVAVGSHANYPIAGAPDDSLDETSRGPLWDPALNYAAFQFLPTKQKDMFRAIDSAKDGKLVPSLKFKGRWGNNFPETTSTFHEGNSKDYIKRTSVESIKAELARSKSSKAKKTDDLEDLEWGKGPTGPWDKTLERIGMGWSYTLIHTRLPTPQPGPTP